MDGTFVSLAVIVPACLWAVLNIWAWITSWSTQIWFSSGLRKCLGLCMCGMYELSLNGVATVWNTFLWNWQGDDNNKYLLKKYVYALTSKRQVFNHKWFYQASNVKRVIRFRHFPGEVINFIAVQPFCRNCLDSYIFLNSGFGQQIDKTQAVSEYHSTPYVW